VLLNLGILLSQCQFTNSVALVRERTILTERPLLVGEVSANFWCVAWSVRRIPYGRNLGSLHRTSLEHSHKVLLTDWINSVVTSLPKFSVNILVNPG
jgi:hypothetical protein